MPRHDQWPTHKVDQALFWTWTQDSAPIHRKVLAIFPFFPPLVTKNYYKVPITNFSRHLCNSIARINLNPSSLWFAFLHLPESGKFLKLENSPCYNINRKVNFKWTGCNLYRNCTFTFKIEFFSILETMYHWLFFLFQSRLLKNRIKRRTHAHKTNK